MANFVAQAESYARSYKWGMLGGYGIGRGAGPGRWRGRVCRPTIVTYVVEVVALEGKKQVVNVSRAGEQYIEKEEFYLWWAREFILCTRGLCRATTRWCDSSGIGRMGWSPPKAPKSSRTKRMSGTSKAMIGTKRIDITWYRQLVNKGTMTVDMTWQETIRDETTGTVTTETWSGQVNLLAQDATTTEEMRKSPMGLWIDHWAWSKL